MKYTVEQINAAAEAFENISDRDHESWVEISTTLAGSQLVMNTVATAIDIVAANHRLGPADIIGAILYGMYLHHYLSTTNAPTKG